LLEEVLIFICSGRRKPSTTILHNVQELLLITEKGDIEKERYSQLTLLTNIIIVGWKDKTAYIT